MDYHEIYLMLCKRAGIIYQQEKEEEWIAKLKEWEDKPHKDYKALKGGKDE